MSTQWFPDNSLICNFAAVDHLGLLRTSLRGSGRIVEAVEYEIEQSSGRVPNLRNLNTAEWFGDAISFHDEKDLRAIESMRRTRFGGDDDRPLEHLGESQTLHLLRTRPEFAGSVWMSEDGGALRVARTMGIITRDSRDVLEELVAFSEIDGAQAFEIAVAIDRADRPFLRMPTSARDFR
jgi:hypothetical protein